MALRYLIGTGDVADPTKWDGGVSVPGTGDDCYANGFTGTISANFTVNSLNTTASGAAAAGGGFTCASAVTITCAAGFTAGTTICLSVTALATVIGNAYGSLTNSAVGVQLAGSSALYGNGYGGIPANAAGVSAVAGCVIYGDAIAGAASNAYGANVSNGGCLVGDSYGGSGSGKGCQISSGACHVGDSYGGSAGTAYGTFVNNGGYHYGKCYGGTNATAYGTLNQGAISVVDHIVDSTGKGLTLSTDGAVILWGDALQSQVNIIAAAGRYRIERGTSSIRPFIRPPIYPAFAS